MLVPVNLFVLEVIIAPELGVTSSHIDAGFYVGDLRDTDHLVTLYEHDGTVSRSVEYQLHMDEPASNGSYFAGGLTISAADLAKLAALLAQDGQYEGVRLMSAEPVELMETHADQTVSDGFYQAMPLRYRTDLYGRDGLYYHTGSAYGVYNCFSYDPVAKDGVVVLSVGASGMQDEYGIYAVCGEICDYIYQIIE